MFSPRYNGGGLHKGCRRSSPCSLFVQKGRTSPPFIKCHSVLVVEISFCVQGFILGRHCGRCELCVKFRVSEPVIKGISSLTGSWKGNRCAVVLRDGSASAAVHLECEHVLLLSSAHNGLVTWSLRNVTARDHIAVAFVCKRSIKFVATPRCCGEVSISHDFLEVAETLPPLALDMTA